MNNAELKNKAKNAIDELYKDKSVPVTDTIRNLESIIFDINVMIETIEQLKDSDKIIVEVDNE